MCLITNQQEPIILEEDLVVYKVLKSTRSNDVVASTARSFEYTLGKLYSTSIEETSDALFADPQDLDDCSQIYGVAPHYFGVSKLYFIKSKQPATKFKVFGAGFHFCKNKKRAIQHIKTIRSSIVYIYKCLIPKGSEVYYNCSDLGVTNNIIVLG